MVHPFERIREMVARKAEMASCSAEGEVLVSRRRLRTEVVVGVAPTAGGCVSFFI